MTPGSGGSVVVGVGIDLAGVARLEAAMQRRKGLAARLFTAAELAWVGRADPVAVAQRFAAKEAVMKALGVGLDSVSFTEIELGPGLDRVTLSGRAGQRATRIGAVHWQVDVASVDGPDGTVATAEVIASSTVS